MRATAQQVALEHLRKCLSDGSLPPDARIRQERVAAEIGASVVPVREALKILEAEGQVLYLPHRGYQVRRLGVAELVETYQLRRLLEDEAVRLGGGQLDEAAFGALESAMATMEEAAAAGDVESMVEANRAFHFGILAGAQMPRMLEFVRQLWQSTDAYRSRYYNDEANRRRVNLEHRQIVLALREQRIDDAVDLLERHRQAAVDKLSRLLGDDRREP